MDMHEVPRLKQYNFTNVISTGDFLKICYVMNGLLFIYIFIRYLFFFYITIPYLSHIINHKKLYIFNLIIFIIFLNIVIIKKTLKSIKQLINTVFITLLQRSVERGNNLETYAKITVH